MCQVRSMLSLYSHSSVAVRPAKQVNHLNNARAAAFPADACHQLPCIQREAEGRVCAWAPEARRGGLHLLDTPDC